MYSEPEYGLHQQSNMTFEEEGINAIIHFEKNVGWECSRETAKRAWDGANYVDRALTLRAYRKELMGM